MQRGGKGGVSSVCDGELDSTELVGHCVAVVGVRVVEEVFARPEEPVESNDGEVDEV